MGRPPAPVREFTCPTCGGKFSAPDKAERRRYCSSSCQPRGIHRGRNNPSYRGGLWQREEDGRWFIACSDGSKERFARAVVEAELHRPLRSDEIVHHINGDPTDDRIENLEIVTRAEHLAIHRSDQHRPLKTHCQRGHPFDDENTYIYRGERYCRTCRAEATRRSYERRMAA